MPIRLYNTLTHQVEDFAPIDPPRVYMYNCGPTVYDFAHIGNFRSFVFADVLRRFLDLAGHEVHQIMNITDVGHMTDDQLADGGGEDKMAAAARRIREDKKSGKVPDGAIDNPDDPYQVAQFFIDAFVADARALGIQVADEYPQHMPRASQHVPQMQALITRLIDSDHAYVADDGAVYFAVESFPEYGRLSGNTLDKLRGGAGGRVDAAHQVHKRHPADFLLWKPDPSHIMKWDSPWGSGYPGWHIECSAMAMTLLGRETIDIHTGGEDNIFPHHECEIAQSRGVTGKSSFANVWMHARFLRVEGEKMSKSRGNFFTVRDLTEGRATGLPVHPSIVRYELLRTHYRANMNFTFKGLQDSALAVHQLRSFERRLVEQAGDTTAQADPSHPVLAKFIEALSDDLNMSGALAAVFEWVGKSGGQSGGRPKGKAATNLAVLRAIDSVLNVLHCPAMGDDDVLARGALSDGELAERLAKINAARQAKDYATADALKDELRAAHYDVMDTPAGTTADPRPVVADPAHID